MENKRQQMSKTLGVLLALFILLTLPTAVMAADDYPNRPVRLIVTVMPGGNNDIIGRVFAAKLADRLGKPVVVENIAGGGSIIGTERAANAAPDGYTLLIINRTHLISPSFDKVPFHPVKSFSAVARVVSSSFALAVHKSVPANSVKEFVALARQKPGQLIFASAGVGSIAHLVTEIFKMKAGIDFKIVQFKGGGPAMVDLAGGHSHAALASLPQMLPLIKSGNIRLLGMGGKKRSVLVPDVPTIIEAGVPYEEDNWWGFLVPAGTPAPIIDRLNHELKAILATDEIKKWAFDAGLDTDYLGPAEFGPLLEEQMATFASIIKNANIKLDQ